MLGDLSVRRRDGVRNLSRLLFSTLSLVGFVFDAVLVVAVEHLLANETQPLPHEPEKLRTTHVGEFFSPVGRCYSVSRLAMQHRHVSRQHRNPA